MRPTFADCFLLVGSVLSLRNDRKVTEMGRPIHGSYATQVDVSITISRMNIINLKTMELQYEVFLHMRWLDHRLSPNEQTQKLAVAGALWRPKVTFSKGQIQMDADDSTQYWRGWGKGNVLYSKKVTVKTDCTKKFHVYPFDKQRCLLKISTFLFPMDEVFLQWNSPSPVEMQVNNDIEEFDIADLMTFTEIETRPSGNFSVLVVEFLIARQTQQLLVSCVLPSILLVFASYLTFWMDVKATFARSLLSFLTSMAMAAVHKSVNSNIPNVPYIKPSDIWCLMCTLFAFTPFVLSIILDSITRSYDEKLMNLADDSSVTHQTHLLVASIDRMARLFYFISFLSCVFIFFGVFML